MLRESGYLVLQILKQKAEKNPDAYFTSREIGEDTIFQSRSVPVYRAARSAGSTLGNLHKKRLVDMIVVFDKSSMNKLYRINASGLKALQNHVQQREIMTRLEQLQKNYELASEYAMHCFDQLNEFKKKYGLIDNKKEVHQ